MAEQVNTREQAVSRDLMEDKQFTCTICMENYKRPRYLSTCGHTFCEHCLFTYARNLQERGSKFACPVCRKPQSFPENGAEVTLKWIREFPLNTVIVGMMGTVPEVTEEKTSERHVCEPCGKQDKAADAVNFCMDCMEAMCETCTTNHQSFKMLEHHKYLPTIQLSAVPNLKDALTGLNKCGKHAEVEAGFYCRSHDKILCWVCLRKQHKTCDLVDLSDHGTDTTIIAAESEELVTRMKAALQHVSLLQKLRVDNKNNLTQRMKEIRETMEQTRDGVVTLMDKLVRRVYDVTKQLDLECENTLDADMAGVQRIKETVQRQVVVLDTVGNHGLGRHTFAAARSLVKQFEDAERQISKEDRRLKRIDVQLKIAEDVTKLLEYVDVEGLADVALSECKSDHRHFDDVVGNTMRDMGLVRREEHTVSFIGSCSPNLTGVAVHKDGRVVLSDHCSYYVCGFLCLYNPLDKSTVKLKLNSPFSATPVGDTQVAVSIPSDKSISIVSVDNGMKVERTFRTTRTPQSIAVLGNGHLGVSWSDPPSFSMVDISGEDLVETMHLDQDSTGRRFQSFNYFAVDERRQRVIQSCSAGPAVYCFDFDGEPVFSYSDAGLLGPRGIALDKGGNIFVCNYVSPGSIYKLSPAGALIRVFTDGVPACPRGICDDGARAGFWVTSGDKIVHVGFDPTTAKA